MAALALAACTGGAASTSVSPVQALPTTPAPAAQLLSETGSSLNYEYAIVSTSQASATRAQDLRAFLAWAVTSGTAQLARVNFQPLPTPIVTLSDAQIAGIRG